MAREQQVVLVSPLSDAMLCSMFDVQCSILVIRYCADPDMRVADSGSAARGHTTLYDSMVSQGGATTALSTACVFCLQLIKASSTSGSIST